MKRKLAGLLAALLLCSCMGSGAFAANQTFTDLPASHWAYQEITRAVAYGIMNGLGDGRMNPDGTLTWAHYLAMISRTFAPMAYEGARSSGTDWRTAGYQTALDKGYLISGDFLTVTPSALNEPISRQDVAVLLNRTLPAARSNASASSGDNSGAGTGAASDASVSGGDSTLDIGDGSGIRITTDSNGKLWIVKDGISIPLSQTVYDVYANDDGDTTAVPGSSVKRTTGKANDDGDTTAAPGSSVKRTTGKANDDGDTTAAPASSVKRTTGKANDDGDTTAVPGSSVKRTTGKANDDGDTTASPGSSVKRTTGKANDDGDTTASPGSSVRPANNDASGDDGETTSVSGSGSSGSASNTPVITPVPSSPAPVTLPDPPLSDFAQMDANHQAAVRRLYELNIVRGKSDGSFGPTDTVRRSDGAVLLMRTLDATDELRSGETVSLTLELVDGDGKTVAETVTGNGRINQSLSSLASVYAPTGYKVAPQDGKVSVISRRYALKFAPLTQAEKEEIEATAQYRSGQITLDIHSESE